MTRALLALAAIAVAVIALRPRRRAPRLLAGSCDDPAERDYSWLWTDDSDVVGMPTELTGVSWGRSGPHLTFNTGVEQPQPWFRYGGTDWDAWMAEYRRNHPDWRN